MIVGRLTGQNEGLSFLTEIPLGRLTSFAKPRQFPKGSQISDGTDLEDAAWFLLSGSCELRRTLEDGTEEVITSFVPGEVFGTRESEVQSQKSKGQGPKSNVEERRASSDLGAEIYSVVATTDTVVLCFDRTTLHLLRVESEGQAKANGSKGSDTADRERAVAGALLSLQSAKKETVSKLVTLCFLSESLPVGVIIKQFAQYLQCETAEDVVLIRFANASKALNGNGGAFWPRRTADGHYELTLAPPAGETGAREFFDTLTRLTRFRYVVVQTDTEMEGAPWLREILVRSDLGYLFVQSGSDALYHLERLVREVRARGRNQAAQLKPIACLKEGEAIDGFDLIAHNLGVPIHLYVRGCLVDGMLERTPRPIFGADIRRLARGASGRMVGLALSSGAAKGFAHIGVLQVCEENGIEVDVVAGASMGAYVGSIWAYGHDGTEMERLAREVEGKWKLWSLVDPVFPPRQGFLRGYAIKRRLERSLGKAQFADLMRPMRVVATNLRTLERTVFSAGQVSTAVHASIAVPGICVPVTLDGEIYIDGGIMDPLPVEVLREMGISRVIAVDVIPTPDSMRDAADTQAAKEERAQSIFRKAISIDKQINYFARGNLFEILTRSVLGAQIRAAEASCRQADVVLRPEILDDRWLDFRHPGKFIALGREVALRHLDELKSLADGQSAAEPRSNGSNGINHLNTQADGQPFATAD